MITVTDEQFDEYLSLKSKYILDSAHAVTRLENDIDAPIKRTVALLALLGCEPVWSCCGYDYHGQPVHKNHKPYGTCWVRMKENESSLWLVDEVKSNPPEYNDIFRMWEACKTTVYKHQYTVVQSEFGAGSSWPDRNCIHFSEAAAIALSVMETYLCQFEDRMLDSVELGDYNAEYRERFPHWEYPPKESWVVRKEEWTT